MSQFSKFTIVKSLIANYHDAEKTITKPFEIKAEKIILAVIFGIVMLTIIIFRFWLIILVFPIFILVSDLTKNYFQKVFTKFIWEKQIKKRSIKIKIDSKTELGRHKYFLNRMAKDTPEQQMIYRQAMEILTEKLSLKL